MYIILISVSQAISLDPFLAEKPLTIFFAGHLYSKISLAMTQRKV